MKFEYNLNASREYIRDNQGHKVPKNPYLWRYRSRTKKRHDLRHATFIIPVKLESPDRIRNFITLITFLIENFDVNIYVKEVDTISKVEKCLPIIKDTLGLQWETSPWDRLPRFRHDFECSEDSLFHRQKVLNEMLDNCTTEIVVNYDVDAILPIESYLSAYQGIMDGVFDVVYPYGDGMYQKQVTITTEESRKWIIDLIEENKECTTEKHIKFLDDRSKLHTSDFGWIQFFRRSTYIEGGMENENFKAYAPEDKERYYRYTTLGYTVGRIENYVYHLEHSRGENSWFTNPYMQDNLDEWEKIQKMDKKELLDYYSRQDYLKKYAGI